MPTGYYERKSDHNDRISQGLRATDKRVGRPPVKPPKDPFPARVPFGFTGKTHSDASKKKMSEKQKGRQGRYRGGGNSISIGQQRIAMHLQEEGYTVYSRGWPDLLAVSPTGTLLAIEVKRPDGRLTTDQVAVHALLAKIGLDVKVVRIANVWEGL